MSCHSIWIDGYLFNGNDLEQISTNLKRKSKKFDLRNEISFIKHECGTMVNGEKMKPNERWPKYKSKTGEREKIETNKIEQCQRDVEFDQLIYNYRDGLL